MAIPQSVPRSFDGGAEVTEQTGPERVEAACLPVCLPAWAVNFGERDARSSPRFCHCDSDETRVS